MIWALLALLGVPIWLVLGALGGAFFSRRQFIAQDGVFALALREGGTGDWPRGTAHGRWIHDVLLVNTGLARIKTAAHAVDHVEPLPPGDLPDKFDDGRAWTLTLDDGSKVDIAVPAEDLDDVPLGG